MRGAQAGSQGVAAPVAGRGALHVRVCANALPSPAPPQEVESYYDSKSGYGKPTSLLLFQLAHSLQQEDNFHIWCARGGAVAGGCLACRPCQAQEASKRTHARPMCGAGALAGLCCARAHTHAQGLARQPRLTCAACTRARAGWPSWA